jgi:hypothetical protein
VAAVGQLPAELATTLLNPRALPSPADSTLAPSSPPQSPLAPGIYPDHAAGGRDGAPDAACTQQDRGNHHPGQDECDAVRSPRPTSGPGSSSRAQRRACLLLHAGSRLYLHGVESGLHEETSSR